MQITIILQSFLGFWFDFAVAFPTNLLVYIPCIALCSMYCINRFSGPILLILSTVNELKFTVGVHESNLKSYGIGFK